MIEKWVKFIIFRLMKTGDHQIDAMSSPIVRMKIGDEMALSFTVPNDDIDDAYC